MITTYNTGGRQYPRRGFYPADVFVWPSQGNAELPAAVNIAYAAHSNGVVTQLAATDGEVTTITHTTAAITHAAATDS